MTQAQVFATREDWLAARQKNIGGSEVAALFGCQPDYALSHYALWQTKSGRIAAPVVEGERPAWGLKLEGVIADAVAEQKHWAIRKGGYVVHPTVKGMAATLDFIATFADGTEGPLETKNADWMIHKRQWGSEPPPHILLQLMHQCSCMGAKRGAIACLIGGNHLEVYEYEARPKIVADIEKRVTAFWKSVADSIEPPVDGSEATAGAIRAMFPEARLPDPIDLTGDNALPELCASYQQYSSIRRQAEKDEQLARNGILAKLGEHAEAFCAGYRIKAPSSGGNPGQTVTKELAESMIGTVIGKRAASRRITIKEAI